MNRVISLRESTLASLIGELNSLGSFFPFAFWMEQESYASLNSVIVWLTISYCGKIKCLIIKKEESMPAFEEEDE